MAACQPAHHPRAATAFPNFPEPPLSAAPCPTHRGADGHEGAEKGPEGARPSRLRPRCHPPPSAATLSPRSPTKHGNYAMLIRKPLLLQSAAHGRGAQRNTRAEAQSWGLHHQLTWWWGVCAGQRTRRVRSSGQASRPSHGHINDASF